MKKYTLIVNSGDIMGESNNKALLIAKARKIPDRATVVDKYGIIFENKAQKAMANK